MISPQTQRKHGSIPSGAFGPSLHCNRRRLEHSAISVVRRYAVPSKFNRSFRLQFKLFLATDQLKLRTCKTRDGLSLTREQQPDRVRADRLHDICCCHFSRGANGSGLVPRSQKNGRKEADKVRLHRRPALSPVSADVEQEALGASGRGIVLQQGLDEQEGSFLALRRGGFAAGCR